LGIIQKQALKSTVVNFIGAAFGAVTRLSMPVVLTEFQIGFLALLDAVSGVFVTVFSLGFEQVLARLFPQFRDDDKGHHGFFLLGVFISLTGVILSFIAYFFLQDLFLPNATTSGSHTSFAIFIFPLILFRILFRNMDGYAGMLMNTVLGAFIEGLVSKLLLLLGLMGFALSFLDFDYLIVIFVFSICFPGMVMLLYGLFKTPKIVLPSNEFTKPKLRKQIIQYIGFGVLMGASNSIIFYVDSLMVNKLISLEALGVYATFFFAARLMAIPSRSLVKISTVVLAESWKEKDMDNIDDVYKKSCLNQLLIGTFLLGLGWSCLEPALTFLPGDKAGLYQGSMHVFFFLGLGLLIELGTGVNSAIIATSDKFKYNTYFSLLLAVCVILLNYIFIHFYDIVGAAVATMLSMTIVNVLRWLFLYKTYKLQPFDLKFMKAVLFSVLFIGLAYLIDYQVSPLIKILINGFAFSALFVAAIFILKLSPDMGGLLNKLFPKKKE
jgi:O-antigen/teichoic acid export membrane protein